MKRPLMLIALYLAVNLLLGANLLSQGTERNHTPFQTFQINFFSNQSSHVPDANSIFNDVENGILSGNTKLFTNYLANQIYLRIRDIEEGYYSSNQAISIVQNFFNVYRVVNFKFTTQGGTTSARYATGGGTLFYRGQRESFQVYVNITIIGQQWVITQFNVY